VAVRFLGQNCFDGVEPLSVAVFPNGSKQQRIGALSFARIQLEKLMIPFSIEVIEFRSFSLCSSLELLMFERDEHLQRIEFFVFASTALMNVSFPNSLGCIHESAFIRVHFTSVSFFPFPTAFTVRDERILVRIYLVGLWSVILGLIERIGDGCFSAFKSVG
jgi:hypothetical protein